MKRRAFLKTLATGILAGSVAPHTALAAWAGPGVARRCAPTDDPVKDYLEKMKDFDQPHSDDIYLTETQLPLLVTSVKRFKRLQRTVGWGNFHLLSFDEAIRIAKGYSRVGPFTRSEIDFLEMIFYADSHHYGFRGEKPLTDMTASIRKDKVVKVPKSGSYIFQGVAFEMYQKIKKEIGDDAVLTSGVRSVIKQFLLFLDKAAKNNGNLSLASRSLAPPGYSFHAISDFDIGQAGFGVANFTERFVETAVYAKLKSLGYLKLRYPRGNHLGVRFEPWHIKVADRS
jgi:hypothetical protein